MIYSNPVYLLVAAPDVMEVLSPIRESVWTVYALPRRAHRVAGRSRAVRPALPWVKWAM